MDEELDIHAAIAINKAHLLSYATPMDVAQMRAFIYEALHISGFHPSIWFGAFMCYRRTGNVKQAQRCFDEACARGDRATFQVLADRYY